ncbi:hypothetical protein LG293_17410 (plasmid) [Citricoccus nitrophenolicus]
MNENQTPTAIPVKLYYKPWDRNREHGIDSVRPVDESEYILRLEPGDVFAVFEDSNKSDGRGPRFLHSLHLDLGYATLSARGLGVQGSLGDIGIQAPTSRDIMAFDADGNEVVVATTIEYRPVNWEKRIHKVGSERV